MADEIKKPLEDHGTYKPMNYKEYSSLIKQDIYDLKEEELDDKYDTMKGLLKKIRSKHRQYAVDTGYFSKDKKFLGYGHIDDKHIDKESGKKIKEVLAEQALDALLFEYMGSVGLGGYAKNFASGIGAMKPVMKEGKEVLVPDHDLRRFLAKEKRDFIDKYIGRGAYDKMYQDLSKGKNITKLLKGDFGKYLQKFMENLHPHTRNIQEYHEILGRDENEADNFKKNVAKEVGEGGLELKVKDVEGHIHAFERYKLGLKADDVTSDDEHFKKKQKKK